MVEKQASSPALKATFFVCSKLFHIFFVKKTVSPLAVSLLCFDYIDWMFYGVDGF
jgi:hypothetical protein